MKPKSKNITKTSPVVTRRDKENLLKQKGTVFWMTGLSGSGKSTIAHLVEKMFYDKSNLLVVLDGDNVRHGLNADLAFSDEDRSENLRRIAEVAKLFAENGIIVITSFISPTRESRDKAREVIEKSAGFYEIFVRCDVDECEKRDPKGLYKKARNGEIKGFTGIDAPFEYPKKADFTVETEGKSIKESAKMLFDFMKEKTEI